CPSLESAHPPREAQAIRTLGIHRPRLFRRSHWLSAGAALVIGLPGGAPAEFYRWTDEQGVTRYSSSLDSIPRKHRSSAQLLNEEPSVPLETGLDRERLQPEAGRSGELEADSPADAPPPESDEAPQPGRARSPESEESPRPAPTGAPPATESAETGTRPPESDAEPENAEPPSEPPREAPAAPPEASSEREQATFDAPARPEPAEAAAPLADPRASERDRLRREIADKRERIKRVIGESGWQGVGFADDPRLQELAGELPRLQADLDALNAEPRR
ncbi:MAG: hypothetical protein J4G09_08975, partial [Proteobacteria bacterium]|nr:hypothetical protein [Pseudomonadota bacterium]